jgi:hypothetical protein
MACLRWRKSLQSEYSIEVFAVGPLLSFGNLLNASFSVSFQKDMPLKINLYRLTQLKGIIVMKHNSLHARSPPVNSPKIRANIVGKNKF